MSTATLPTIAFFGATGGCVATTLAHCLRDGYKCTALVRNADKLTNLLKTHDITPETISSNLTIHTGNIKSIPDVATALSSSPDIIISGLGSAPVWQGINPIPTLQDPTVCFDGMTTIVSALKTSTGKKPLLVAISTTGISKHGRDIPLAYVPLYYGLLHVPHVDKEKMEDLVIAQLEGVEKTLSDYVIVRASLLTDGPALGMDAIRAESENGEPNNRNAIGYTISRKDVGGYIFEEVIKKFQGGNGKGKIVRITY